MYAQASVTCQGSYTATWSWTDNYSATDPRFAWEAWLYPGRNTYTDTQPTSGTCTGSPQVITSPNGTGISEQFPLPSAYSNLTLTLTDAGGSKTQTISFQVLGVGNGR